MRKAIAILISMLMFGAACSGGDDDSGGDAAARSAGMEADRGNESASFDADRAALVQS